MLYIDVCVYGVCLKLMVIMRRIAKGCVYTTICTSPSGIDRCWVHLSQPLEWVLPKKVLAIMEICNTTYTLVCASQIYSTCPPPPPPPEVHITVHVHLPYTWTIQTVLLSFNQW